MNRRGSTLAEVLVAGSIMVLITGVLSLIYRQSITVQKSQQQKSDIFQVVLIASSKLRADLGGARIIKPSPGQQLGYLEYKLPLRDPDTGRVQIDAQGEVVWEDPSRLELDAEGKLILSGPNPRTLAELGEDADLLSYRVDNRVMLVTLTVVDNGIVRAMPLTFYLSNQP